MKIREEEIETKGGYDRSSAEILLVDSEISEEQIDHEVNHAERRQAGGSDRNILTE